MNLELEKLIILQEDEYLCQRLQPRLSGGALHFRIDGLHYEKSQPLRFLLKHRFYEFYKVLKNLINNRKT